MFPPTVFFSFKNTLSKPCALMKFCVITRFIKCINVRPILNGKIPPLFLEAEEMHRRKAGKGRGFHKKFCSGVETFMAQGAIKLKFSPL